MSGNYRAYRPNEDRDPSVEEALTRYDQNSLRRDTERAIRELHKEVDELRDVVIQLIDLVMQGRK
jgi:hypothetical protein